VLAIQRRRLVPAVGADPLTESAPALQRDGAVERTRDTWARAGVLVNELARPVLFLNLPTGASENACWHRGEPAYISLRALLRSPPSWDVAGQKTYVCENPNLLAIAADRLGRDCAPLVCIEGMPAAAQQSLLSQLAQAGARLCYHGDWVSARHRGASAPPITRLRSEPRRAWGILSKASRSRHPGTPP